MKYLSKSTVFESWQNIVKQGEFSRVSLNKFFGILEILKQINIETGDLVVSNYQYSVFCSQLSSSLQDKFFFDENNKKTFASQDKLNIIFPNYWANNIFQIILKGNKISLKNVACICLQNEEFKDGSSDQDVIDKFLNTYHINDVADIFFSRENEVRVEFLSSLLNRNALFLDLKKYFNITDNSKFTIGFDNVLITANPGELTRGPFIQPLYSGQENLKCLLVANFDITKYYKIREPEVPLADYLINKTSPHQKIFYGAPGTGKSHKVKELVAGKEERTERVTFHPEYDYNAFIGGYKPTMNGDDIRYEFVPQAFTNIYVKAWNDLGNDYYLVIEEINRGNCAEIFGDIFQLLDRNSDYAISPSKELKEFLLNKAKGLINEDFGLEGGKLKLPNNLNILATMNTSDQSLFPMDSAFKRRWDWEYIPINYNFSNDNESSKFKVKLSETESFSWLSFILSVNSFIKQNDNLGMDKCLGNYFIKPTSDIIDIKTFINKAIFYLWNDVFKDEMEENNIFLNKTSYEDFFPIQPKGIEKVKEILNILKIKIEE